MNKKRLLLAVLCLILTMSLLGCQSPQRVQDSEDPPSAPSAVDWMPFGLEFRMSYEAFAAALQEFDVDVPQLRAATTNAGYVAGPAYMTTTNSSPWEFLHSDDLSAMMQDGVPEDAQLSSYKIDLILARPALHFSFNENKELYECGLLWSVSDVESEFNQWFVEEVVTAYNAKFGTQSDTTVWETETMGGSLQSHDDDDGKIMMLVLHSKAHELNS